MVQKSRYILTNASRRGIRIFKIFSTEEKSEHFVASKVRWDEGQRQRVALEEKTRRNVQDADDEDDHCWTETCEGIAKRMSKCSEDSEVTKVSTSELKEQVLSPSESSVKIVRIAGQARNGKSKMLIQISRHGANEVFIASMARWEEQLKGLVMMERHCLTLREEVER